MRKAIRLAALCLTAVLSLSRAAAQTNTNTISFSTNVLLKVNFSLTTFLERLTPGGPVTGQAKTTTKEIINALGLQLGRGTNSLAGAELLLRTTSLGTSNETAGFILRKGTNDTDVSNFLQFDFPQGRTVRSQKFNPKTGTTNVISYTIMEFFLFTSTGSFDVQGLAKLSSSSLVSKRTVINGRPSPNAIRVAVAGSGTAGGFPAIFRGNVTIAGRTIEIQQVSGP